MTARPSDTSLDALRQEIDAIDDQMLKLLAQRFAATEKVRASKAQDGSLSSSPFRPAREAAMMRRLIGEAGKDLSPELLVRLWRVLLSASIQSQAPVTLHMDASLGHDLGTRVMLAQHFFAMPVVLHGSPSEALASLRNATGDLAVIATSSDWAGGSSPPDGSEVQVIGTLPILASGSRPQLLLFGHATPQPSGEDETLVLIPGEASDILPPLWTARTGVYTLASLPGFLADDAPPLRSILNHYQGARVAGRAPRPIKVSP